MQGNSCAILEAQHLVLSMLEKARSCRQQLEGVKVQLDLARERAISVKEASAGLLFDSMESWHAFRRNAFKIDILQIQPNVQ